MCFRRNKSPKIVTPSSMAYDSKYGIILTFIFGFTFLHRNNEYKSTHFKIEIIICVYYVTLSQGGIAPMRYLISRTGTTEVLTG